MSPDSAPARRAYRSPRRLQQAAETRAAVVDAALLLFADRGWAATGMRDIAREAGVSVETVYANFPAKTDLLMAALDVAVVGDAEPVSLSQRPEFTVLGRGNRKQRARAAAHLVTTIHQRTAGVNLALREAAASDDEAARRVRESEQRRRLNVEEGITLVAGRAPTAEECDGLWAVMDVEVYRLLTDLRGWTTEKYEEWLAGVIDRLLHVPGRRT
jgi:AcrR family transcriptional regulator